LEWISGDALEEVLISSTVTTNSDARGRSIEITPTENHKCGRCWRHLPEVADDGALCNRCETVLGEG
jgi:isoleucyl-tRNA synthetase